MQKNDGREPRTGYTTGTCATAATAAALKALLRQEHQKSVSITLSTADTAVFPVEECFLSAGSARCGVRKDAGDDPDVTNGLIICSDVSLRKDIPKGEIVFLKGEGVGTVTLSGLGIPVGEPAVNPVPREMIARAVRLLLKDYRIDGGVSVTLSIPGGEGVAKKTMNEKLGVTGGLSIIGTSGIVIPYSEEAYLESIRRSLDVAASNGCRDIVTISGRRNEKHLKKLFPLFPDPAFIHYGNRLGQTLEMMREYQSFESVAVGVMLAKATKLAQGELDMSSRNVPLNRDYIASLAEKTGYDIDVCRRIHDLRLVRNIAEIIPFRKEEPFYRELARECYTVTSRYVEKGVRFTFVLSNIEGDCIVIQ